MSSFNNSKIQVLKNFPFFSGLRECELEFFVKSAISKNYAKHHTLFLQGDIADRFFAIIRGWVKIYRHTREGEEAVLDLYSRGEVFGETAIFDGKHYTFSAETVEECELYEIPAKVLEQRAEANHEVMEKLTSLMSHRVIKLQLESEHMLLMSAAQRVGCLLLQLSASISSKGGTFSLPYDKTLAAAKLGIEPETFSRALSKLESYGVTNNGSEIRIENFERLAVYCCSACSAELQDCRAASRKPGTGKTNHT